MDSWPTDDRQLGNSRRKAKGKGKEKENHNNYPHFQQGLLTALTLLENNGRLEWSSLLNKHSKENLVAKGKFVNIFPATRPPPPRVAQSIVQRAEQGAHFLRTYFPDVDITDELIRDEVVADAKFSRRLEAFDPYMGNLLESICCPTGPSKQAVFLAFPMGDLNADLNVSPFSHTKANYLTFKPLGTPSQTFPTPIRQIVSSSPLAGAGQSSHLAVRTFGSTSFFEIKATASSSSPSAQFIDIEKVVSSDVGNRPLVDLKFSTPESGGILVNDHGAVYTYSFVEGRKTFQLVYPAPTETPEDFFWRVIPSEHDHSCILASYKHVQQVDFRTNNSVLGLLSIRQPRELVTSINTYRGDHLVHLVTTNEILWIDDRFPRKPLLGIKHGRQFDRYLEVKTVSLQKTPLTLLTSRRNGLVTVYDVCRSKDNLLHINAQPYSPQAIIGPETPYLGYTFFRHPSDPNDSHIGLFTMSERGSIHRLKLEIPTGAEETLPGDDSHVYEWSKDVEELNVQAKDPPSDFELVDARDSSMVNLDSAYGKIFLAGAEDTDRGENTPETVYEILDRIPFFWQESNGHLEHMVTLFDVAFRSGEEPSHPSRADFLTQCALNSTRGYRALVQGRVLPTPLTTQAPWHYRISPILKHFDADMSEDTQVTVDRLRRYDLAVHPDRTSLRRESEAREQLALDLGLSIDVFSPQPISKPAVDMFENMSRAAEALSLDDEPPAIHFGYLRPVKKRAANCSTDPNYDNSSSDNDDPTSPMGVRLLLKEWEIGTDPRNYIYKDPYNDTVADSLTPRSIKGREVNPLVARTQRPPSVVASSIPQAMLGRFKIPVKYPTQGPSKRHGKKRVDGF